AQVNEVIDMVRDDMHKLDESLDKLSREIEQLQTKLNDARARQKAILMRHTATQSRRTVNAKLHSHSIDDAINRFEHYERKIETMESEIEANAIGNKGIAAEFEALEKEGRIEQELAALKTKLEKK